MSGHSMKTHLIHLCHVLQKLREENSESLLVFCHEDMTCIVTVLFLTQIVRTNIPELQEELSHHEMGFEDLNSVCMKRCILALLFQVISQEPGLGYACCNQDWSYGFYGLQQPRLQPVTSLPLAKSSVARTDPGAFSPSRTPTKCTKTTRRQFLLRSFPNPTDQKIVWCPNIVQEVRPNVLPSFPNLTTLNLASNKIAGESLKHLSKLTLIYLSSNTYFIKKCVQWDISQQ